MKYRMQQAFTLIELLVVMVLLSILMSLAVPGVVSLLNSSKQTAALNQLMSVLNYARGTAVTQGLYVTVCSGDGTSCNTGSLWQDQLMVFLDTDADGTLDQGDEVVQKVEYLAENMRWYWSRGKSIRFRPDGTAANGSFRLCNQTELQKRKVVVNMTGRPRITDITDNDNPANCSG